jgi:quercetin dioxygenase-like cupin family protein
MHRRSPNYRVSLIFSAALTSLLLGSGCAVDTPKPAVSPTATATTTRSATAALSATPAEPSFTEAMKFEVKVGAPPADGWRWVLGEIRAGSTAVADVSPDKHADPWLFYAVAGPSQITTAGKTDPLNAGTGYWLPAGQDHSHRWEPGARVLVVQLKARPPERVHGSDVLLTSEKVLGVKAGTEQTLRVREFTIAPGASLPERVMTEYAIAYVVEGTLTSRVAGAETAIAAGKAVEWRADVPHAARNAGTVPARIVLIDVRG